jgi:hypothetical protein
MTNEYLEHTVTVTIPGIVAQEVVRLAREVYPKGFLTRSPRRSLCRNG